MDLIEALAKATAPRHLKGSGATATAPVIMRIGSRPASRVREWSDADAVKDGYKGNVWVRAALGRLATAAARVPLIANVKIGDEWVPSEEASGAAGSAVRELAERLEMPNPKMDRAGFVGRAIIAQNLTGNFLAFMAGRGEEPIGPRDPVAALWPLVSGFRPVRDDTGYAEAYENKAITQGRKKYPAAEVLHWMFEDPEDSAWGCPPLQAAAGVVDADNEAMRWNAEAMKRRAVKDVLISFEGFPTTEQYQATRQMIDEQLQGASNAHGGVLLPGGATLQDLARSPVEMDFIESQKLTIQKVAAVFGVPIPLLSTEVQTYSNYQNAMRDLWMNAVIPWLDAFVGVLNRDLVPHYGGRSKLWISYDLANVEALREDQAEKSETLERLLRNGVPYNVAIDFLELDLPPIEVAGDVPHGVSLGKLAIDSRAAALPAGDGEDGEAEPAPTAALEAPAEDVAQTALNGAQVQALREIVQSVVAQELPPEAAIALIMVAFPTVPEDLARRIVESAAAFVPEKKPQPALPPAPIEAEATLVNGRRPRMVAAGRGPSARKAALLEELSPLWTLADRTADQVAAAYRRIAGELRERVNLDQVRAALASGDAAAVAQAVGVERLRVDLAALVPVVGAGARVAVDRARQQLSTRAGRDIVIDGAVAGRFASSATDRAVDFIASSSARGVAEALATLRGTEATAVTLPKVAEVFAIMALLNGQQATQAAKFLVDLLVGGAALDSSLTKVERLAERALLERAIGIGGDLGPRAAWGGQRAAFDHARETLQVREIRRIWADSDDGDVCPECISLDEQTVGGDELYVSPISGKSYYGPPDPHPKSCRCGEGMAEVVV